MPIDLRELYRILRDFVTLPPQFFYGTLSQRYCERTGVWVNPRFGWRFPLGRINRALAVAGLPALSVRVIANDHRRQPGNGFSGCAANVPELPEDQDERGRECARILQHVMETDWPEDLP